MRKWADIKEEREFIKEKVGDVFMALEDDINDRDEKIYELEN